MTPHASPDHHHQPQAQCHSRRVCRPSWVSRALPRSTAADPDSWPPRNPALSFDWSSPTVVAYRDTRDDDDADSTMGSDADDDPQPKTTGTAPPRAFAPAYRMARGRLDYSYHANLVLNRQLLQDAILDRVVAGALSHNSYSSGNNASTSDGKKIDSPEEGVNSSVGRRKRPWIVFTAGPMGVGKGYVLAQLHQANLFSVTDYVKIDPDMIKAELPEMAGYLRSDRASAATKLHRESTQMADVLFEHALARRLPVLVDGSLRDVAYYQALFDRLHRDHASYRIAIVHVTADRAVILERAAVRAAATGRVVPPALLEASLRQVPRSVALLSHTADAVHVIGNNEGQPLRLLSSTVRTAGARSRRAIAGDKIPPTWEDFAQSWNDESAVVESVDQEGAEYSTTAADRSRAAARRRRGSMVLPAVRMATVFDSAPSLHAAANDIWRPAYPNFCARCALACDGQCGVCVHGRHLCACPTCHHHNNSGGGGEACRNGTSRIRRSSVA